MITPKPLVLSWFLSFHYLTLQVSSFEMPVYSSRYYYSQKISRKSSSLSYSPLDEKEDSILDANIPPQMTRTSFLSSLALLTTTTAANPKLVLADDETPTPTNTPKTYSISSCPPQARSACVSTTSVKGAMKTYAGPWTFSCTPEKAFSTLLDILKFESNSITITVLDKEAMYIKAKANRSLGVTDDLEFYVKGEDNVIIYKSIQSGLEDSVNKDDKEVNDLSANRKRLERLRGLSNGEFGVMGDMAADDYMNASKGGSNGPLGQLKAFYGLQSGGGFEDVFD